MEAKAGVFGNMNKIVKHLPRLIRNKREKTNITNLRNETTDITTDSTNIKRVIRKYYEQIHIPKMTQQLRDE